MNYVSRRICALEGSSVNITSESSGQSVNSWNKVKRRDEEDDETLTDDAGRVEFHVIKNYHIMSINNLMKNDSAEYTFTPRKYKQGRTQSDLSGVTLVVTGNYFFIFFFLQFSENYVAVICLSILNV